jgi:hypothetical protein
MGRGPLRPRSAIRKEPKVQSLKHHPARSTSFNAGIFNAHVLEMISRVDSSAAEPPAEVRFRKTAVSRLARRWHHLRASTAAQQPGATRFQSALAD